MKNRILAVAILLLTTLSGAGNAAPEKQESNSAGTEVSRGLVDVLKTNHPELYADIAVLGAAPDDTVILFLLKRGGTYVLRNGATQMLEPVYHAKFITPGSIDRITYENRAFLLWSGEELQLRLAVSP